MMDPLTPDTYAPDKLPAHMQNALNQGSTLLQDENGNYYEFESLKLPKGYIKGTVGAGDAFCAGVLYAAETDMPLPEALKLGACSAAASLSEVSASDGVKAKDEVLKLYELYGKK